MVQGCCLAFLLHLVPWLVVESQVPCRGAVVGWLVVASQMPWFRCWLVVSAVLGWLVVLKCRGCLVVPSIGWLLLLISVVAGGAVVGWLLLRKCHGVGCLLILGSSCWLIVGSCMVESRWLLILGCC